VEVLERVEVVAEEEVLHFLEFREQEEEAEEADVFLLV
jgi:hypothetical protein